MEIDASETIIQEDVKNRNLKVRMLKLYLI